MVGVIMFKISSPRDGEIHPLRRMALRKLALKGMVLVKVQLLLSVTSRQPLLLSNPVLLYGII